MTLEGHSECSNCASKCPFTLKDTHRHCQHPTVAQNAGPVRPFPAPALLLTPSARGSSLPIGPQAPGGVDASGSALGAFRSTTPGPEPSRSGARRRRGLSRRGGSRRRRSDDVGPPWGLQRAPGSFRALAPLQKPGPRPQGALSRHAIASGAHFVRVKYHDKQLLCPKLWLAKRLTPLVSTPKCTRA